MRRSLLLWAGMTFTMAVQAGEGWSSLWLNSDQRGERLLQQGDAAAAASTYSDPRRKALAQLKAGDGAAAARGFEAFDDADAHYNRGNALVQAGDLKAALGAYDRALSQDPASKDAKHNRDLVEQALKKQQEQQAPSPSPEGEGSPESGEDGKQGKDANTDPGSRSQDAAADPPGQNSEGPQGKPNEASETGQQASKESVQDSPPSPGEQNGESNPSGQDASESSPDPPGDEAAQARRDAEQSLRDKDDAKARSAAAGSDDNGDPTQASADAVPVPATPSTEQQLAQEQWLRRIPDDPGGLLRRKFMIEHLLRQQQQQSPP
ncbi:MAG: tetratricopeptide repeat protein [Panacagrimonas sp.]